MTRKNKVDDLLTRFERKPINQKKCPYCHFDKYHDDPNDTLFSDGCEIFIRQNQSMDIYFSEYRDPELGNDYEFNFKIEYCPKCGRKL